LQETQKYSGNQLLLINKREKHCRTQTGRAREEFENLEEELVRLYMIIEGGDIRKMTKNQCCERGICKPWGRAREAIYDYRGWGH
jgi:hypothetical protein